MCCLTRTFQSIIQTQAKVNLNIVIAPEWVHSVQRVFPGA